MLEIELDDVMEVRVAVHVRRVLLTSTLPV